MKVAILQPGYLPWLGFFDLMYKADCFVIFDDVQYTIRDWRNRNRIKTPDGVLTLTVPVNSRGVRNKLIKDVEIDNTIQWQKKHLKSLSGFYKKSNHFEEIAEIVETVLNRKYTFLIDLDMAFIFKVREFLDLDTMIIFSSEIPSTGRRDDKLLSICKSLNATTYLSGNAAKNYLRESIFHSENINVQWHDYNHPYYNQLWLEKHGFISHLSIVDLLFNHGRDSRDILTGKKSISKPEKLSVRHADKI